MPRLLAAVALALVAAMCVAGPAAAVNSPARDIEQDVDYVAEAVDGWTESPLYVDPSQTELLSTEQAQVLAERIRAGRQDTFVAVVPAAALGDEPGDDRAQQARAFLSAVSRRQGTDGVYIASFGGAGTYGEAVGVPVDVRAAIAAELQEHGSSQVPQLLDAVLTRLGYPGGGTAKQTSTLWIWVLGGLMVALAVAVVAAIRRFLRRRKEQEQAAAAVERGDEDRAEDGEGYGSRAPYPASFDVLPDQRDTVEDRIALARQDVARLGQRLDAAGLTADEPRVAGHWHAAIDAYADASRHVEEAATDKDLRRVREIADYSRWRLACAQAVRAGEPPPPRRAVCFVDPMHGMSVTDLRYAPAGGVAREVPLCADCVTRIRAGKRS